MNNPCPPLSKFSSSSSESKYRSTAAQTAAVTVKSLDLQRAQSRSYCSIGSRALICCVYAVRIG